MTDNFNDSDENRGPQMLRVVFWGTVAVYTVAGLAWLIW